MKERSYLISSLIASYNFKVIAEIGVSRGDNARRIIENLKTKHNNYQLNHFYLIDLPEEKKNPIYALYPQQILTYPNTHYMPIGSDNALKEFEDNSLDLIFLDGDHRQEVFLSDINKWLAKLKQGGILMGDEYLTNSSHSCYYRTEVLNKRFDIINHVEEERLSEGQRTHLWWVQK